MQRGYKVYCAALEDEWTKVFIKIVFEMQRIYRGYSQKRISYRRCTFVKNEV
jgi:hypothetical protein